MLKSKIDNMIANLESMKEVALKQKDLFDREKLERDIDLVIGEFKGYNANYSNWDLVFVNGKHLIDRAENLLEVIKDNEITGGVMNEGKALSDIYLKAGEYINEIQRSALYYHFKGLLETFEVDINEDEIKSYTDRYLKIDRDSRLNFWSLVSNYKNINRALEDFEIEEVYGIKATEGKESIKNIVKGMDFKNIDSWTNHFYQKYLELNMHDKVKFWWLLDSYCNLDRVFTRLKMIQSGVTEMI